jgi:hypothetical protein
MSQFIKPNHVACETDVTNKSIRFTLAMTVRKGKKKKKEKKRKKEKKKKKRKKKKRNGSKYMQSLRCSGSWGGHPQRHDNKRKLN